MKRMLIALVIVLGIVLFTGLAEAGGKEAQKQAADPKTALCKPHAVPQADCFICNATLREKGRLWCNEHGRYEDRCWICHPEAQDKARPFCTAHYLYEDECYLCHPELKKKDKPPTAAPAGDPKNSRSN